MVWLYDKLDFCNYLREPNLTAGLGWLKKRSMRKIEDLVIDKFLPVDSHVQLKKLFLIIFWGYGLFRKVKG